ncbi:amino acid transporter [Rickettsiella grylli]|uniref:APC family permease n=1 Tax=Rickettsiella grylli TaxID=59196 RepID=UPI0008FD5274|nr:APC family permease [Rickettsiella grylli]OJA00103.1 amino acid transporter [Rickettsiella grylli]
MTFFQRLGRFLLGKPRNPLNPSTQRNIALVAFLAWVGLGADGLSSSCYGPEEAFIALGPHYSSLGLYISIATILTVFVIALAYNQVITLFPSGGGGYKVSTQLLGPYAGLISGAALIVDYVLTITISVASGIDALLSLLPSSFLNYKLFACAFVIIVLITLNLRGMKESIKVLMPIFLGFVVTHFFLIIYGVMAHKSTLPRVFSDTFTTTFAISQQTGWLFITALLLRAYSLGSGTYTGIEAVSNNVNRLMEPRVRTGKWTMFYMALSLSFTAGGIILLYLLWHAHPVYGQTLNAVVFHHILGDSAWAKALLTLTLLLEAGLLLVGANTGFLAGPSVLANMAIDSWVPNRFRHLSSRLVTQNGIIVFGIAALLILWLSEGRVSWLVILYSMNVFLTFSLSILGLCVYWVTHRKDASSHWLGRFIFSSFAFLVTFCILITTLISKFTFGGWVTVFITSLVIFICLLVKKHYTLVFKKLHTIDLLMTSTPLNASKPPKPLQPKEATAVIMVGKHRGIGLYNLLWVLRMFPNHFKNFIFVTVGIVDVESFSARKELTTMQKNTQTMLDYFITYCHEQGLAAKSFVAYGTDPTEKLTLLSKKIIKEFPNSIFFASKLIFTKDNWITRLLHNETAIMLQRRLHLLGAQLVILPMKID